jgi:D-threo-aldose 1-dehydrogenase
MIERLGFGAASLGNLYREVDDTDAEAVLEAAWAGGIRSFDTAPHYGLGLSERRLGAFLAGRPRDDFVVSTKVGRVLEPNAGTRSGRDTEGFVVPDDLVRRWDPSPAGIERSLDDSLGRLGLDRIDTLFLHDPDVYDLDSGITIGLPALIALRDRGVVSSVGVGVNTVDAALRAVREADVDAVMIAGRYTLLEQPAAEELLPLCAERGVRVVAAAVFNSGLLAADRPESAHYDYGDVPLDVALRTRRLARICGRHGVALPAAALRFPLRHPAVDEVVVGTGRASSLRANLEHARAVIPDALWDELRDEGLIEAVQPERP